MLLYSSFQVLQYFFQKVLNNTLYNTIYINVGMSCDLSSVHVQIYGLKKLVTHQ